MTEKEWETFFKLMDKIVTDIESGSESERIADFKSRASDNGADLSAFFSYVE